MSTSSICSELSQSQFIDSSIPSTVRIVIPTSPIPVDVPIVTPTESTADLSDNAITSSNKEKIGRWTDNEHIVFLEGLEKHGKQWKIIAGMIGTRTVVQVRTHAQKYFQKMERKKLAASSSISSADSLSNEDVEKPTLQKRKSLPSAFPSTNTKKKMKLSPRLSLPGDQSALSSDSSLVSEFVPSSSGNLSKSASTSSADWSTDSPNGVIGELLDFTMDKLSMQYIPNDAVANMEIQEFQEDPLEWLVDLDAQQYLPESSLPMFPELVEAAPAPPTSSYLVEDALLNNMVDPNVTLQSLFPHNDEFFDEL